MTKDQMHKTIVEMQSRLAYLEGRVATLEQRRYYDPPLYPYIAPRIGPPDYTFWDDRTTVETSIGGATLAVT